MNIELFFFLIILQVRTRFIAKLHKGLARGIPFKCLPLDFLGFYAMVCNFLFSKKIVMIFEKWKKMITILRRIHEKIFLYFSKVGMESDKTVKEGTKRYMIGDINSRKDCIKTMTYSSCKFLTPVTYNYTDLLCAKGQLISKCLIGSIVSTKKPTKFF